jgi:hypothetical protein
MSWDAAEFIKDLTARVERFDQKGAAALCEELIAHLAQRPASQPYPIKEAKRVLQLLRRKRWFTLMQNVAEALIDKVEDSLQIRRQYAQSLIDQGNMPDALAVLDELITDTAADQSENAEARGLKGRIYKQLYVNARNPASPNNRKNLERAIRAYLEVYDLDSKEYLWQGINVVALLFRARRDGVALTSYPDPTALAETILSEVREKDADAKAEQWDYATAVEACVALDLCEEAALWLGKYFRAQYADAFELASTLRQLTEVWELDPSSACGQLLLTPLQAALLQRKGGQLELGAADLKPKPVPRLLQKSEYEKVYGTDTYFSVGQLDTAKERCRAVARIGRDAMEGIGTGFLVKGSDLCADWGDEPVLITNAHVINEDEADEEALRPEQAVIIFQLIGLEQYRVKEVLWSSPPGKFDATIVRLDRPVPCDSLYPVAKRLPVLDPPQQVYVIGHPGGRALSLSLQDNLLLDHQDPLIHYRTPTEGGSSGSPVFNRQWMLIGLHHAGSENMQRLNGKEGTYAANEGIWIRAIQAAIAAEKGAG